MQLPPTNSTPITHSTIPRERVTYDCQRPSVDVNCLDKIIRINIQDSLSSTPNTALCGHLSRQFTDCITSFPETICTIIRHPFTITEFLNITQPQGCETLTPAFLHNFDFLYPAPKNPPSPPSPTPPSAPPLPLLPPNSPPNFPPPPPPPPSPSPSPSPPQTPLPSPPPPPQTPPLPPQQQQQTPLASPMPASPPPPPPPSSSSPLDSKSTELSNPDPDPLEKVTLALVVFVACVAGLLLIAYLITIGNKHLRGQRSQTPESETQTSPPQYNHGTELGTPPPLHSREEIHVVARVSSPRPFNTPTSSPSTNPEDLNSASRLIASGRLPRRLSFNRTQNRKFPFEAACNIYSAWQATMQMHRPPVLQIVSVDPAPESAANIANDQIVSVDPAPESAANIANDQIVSVDPAESRTPDNNNAMYRI